MNLLGLTLWDLLPRRKSGRKAEARPRMPPRTCPRTRPRTRPRVAGASRGKASPMQQRYDALVEEMKQRYGFKVRKWRRGTSGCAWEIRYRDGTIARWIESPYPTGPMSCAVFLHEVGHHAIGLRRFSPRCLEEYHAWMWSLEAMKSRGFNVTDAVHRRVTASLRYAVAKARRRGIRSIPPELRAFE